MQLLTVRFFAADPLFSAISCLLTVHPHLTEVLQELEWDNLPTSEWKVLENYRYLLEPFARYTDLMGGEEYTTLSMVVPILLELNYL